MCDAEFDRVEARWEAFTPWVRATLRSPSPWAEATLLEQIAREFPGLCGSEEGSDTGMRAPPWKTTALQVIAFERGLLPSTRPPSLAGSFPLPSARDPPPEARVEARAR